MSNEHALIAATKMANLLYNWSQQEWVPDDKRHVMRNVVAEFDSVKATLSPSPDSVPVEAEAVGRVVTYSVGVASPYQAAVLDVKLPEGTKLYTSPPAHQMSEEVLFAWRDREYLSGAQAGWNLGVVEDVEGMRRLQESRHGYLKILKASGALTAAKEPPKPAPLPQGWREVLEDEIATWTGDNRGAAGLAIRNIAEALSAISEQQAALPQCNCPGAGKMEASSHAPNCPVRKAPLPQGLPEWQSAVEDAIMDYFALGVAEGRENRDHDTAEYAAQFQLAKITELLFRPSWMAGKALVPVDTFEELLEWLDSCLKCKNWIWDPDQRAAAEFVLEAAQLLLPQGGE